MRQRRLRPAVAAERVAVLGRDVGGQRGGRGQVAAVLALHGLRSASPPGQKGVAEQLAQQSILGEIVQELGEVLQKDRKKMLFTVLYIIHTYVYLYIYTSCIRAFV